ncbi:nucleolar protein 16-like [Gigantopelta aegis]|uniref:nucleolar protein 16-like n=1 Tax=Gigantopelta aegis TaxID=1735272 RepID=UPI001B88E238|nr:nucleolar protein 16-like [Gigantopelta aegis]
MGKAKQQHRKKKFNYSKDRKRIWQKLKKTPTITCDEIRSAYDKKKSLKQNMIDMGLAMDPNQTIKIPKSKERFSEVQSLSEAIAAMNSDALSKKEEKLFVRDKLEAEANAPQERMVRLSEPEARFCIHMMEQHGEDYKAMARDPKNYYQETPKQIRRKINIFKSIPEQYGLYLSSKKSKDSTMDARYCAVVILVT